MPHVSNYLRLCPSEIYDTFSFQAYAPCETILSQNEEASYVYILLEGQAKVSSITPEGNKYLEYIYTPGELFGEIEVLNAKPILSSIEALTPCETIRIPGDSFKKWLLMDSTFCLYITTQLATKLYQSSMHAQTNIAYPLRHRILYFLSLHSELDSNKGISKDVIVESVLSNMRSVNRVLRELSDEGLITVQGGIVRLL